MINMPVLRLFIIVVLIFVTPMLVGGGQSSRAVFDRVHRDNLVVIKPDHVFIGSSLLLSRMDLNHFNTVTNGETGYILGDVASLSALWFLWLKNSLIASEIQPKRVFIFFRYTELTDPVYGTGSLFVREKIQKNSSESEPYYERVSSYHKGLIVHLKEWFLWLYPIQEVWHKSARWLIDSAGYMFVLPDYIAYKWRTIFNPKQVARADVVRMLAARKSLRSDIADKIFTSSNMRKQNDRISKSSTANSKFNFKERLPISFLPEIVRLGREAGLNMVFVRMKSRPNRDNSFLQDLPLLGYMEDLAKYAKENGIIFHDFTGDENIHRSMYQDDGHIAPKFMKLWTENFVMRFAEHLH
jgi:hypothetical protein